jgi:predicted  nucleic acid-binding Zn-ribbon protein
MYTDYTKRQTINLSNTEKIKKLEQDIVNLNNELTKRQTINLSNTEKIKKLELDVINLNNELSNKKRKIFETLMETLMK